MRPRVRGLVPGIHVLNSRNEKGVDSRHRREEATPSFRRLCSAMTVSLICPSCQFAAARAVDLRPKSPAESALSRLTEGRLAIVTDARRDAVDADGAQRRSALPADGKVVWS
jgi:hypothetical protein